MTVRHKRAPVPKIQEVTDEVGRVYKTNNCGDVVVLEYFNNKQIVIKFLNTGNIKKTQKHQISKGMVSDELGLVHGVGLHEDGKYKAHKSKEYALWTGMLGRCYSPIALAKCPAYLNCYVSDNFKNFQYFAEWCNNQVGFKEVGYHMDKDLLSGDNKIYSEDTVVFVPAEINQFLTFKKSNSKNLGVHFRFGRFRAEVRIDSKTVMLGAFKTLEEASLAYKTAKEAHARVLAIRYKGLVDERVIEALNNFVVKITK